jgi:hypothetical protein
VWIPGQLLVHFSFLPPLRIQTAKTRTSEFSLVTLLIKETVPIMRTFLLHTLLYGASLGATTTNGALRLFESIAEAPQEWNDIGRPDPNTELSLSILLTPVSVYNYLFSALVE